MSTGYAILMDINGKKIDFSTMPKGYKTHKMANLKRLEARSSWMVTAVGSAQIQHEGTRYLCDEIQEKAFYVKQMS